MRRSRAGNFLGLIFCSALLGGLAAGAFGTLCMALYWILSGGDTQGNPFGPIWFALAGVGAGFLMGLCRALDQLGDWDEPEILCGKDLFTWEECAKKVYWDDGDAPGPSPAPERNGKTLSLWKN
jgi:hypothetical protein